MTEYKPITIDELLALSRKQFIDRMQAWIKEFGNGNEYLDIDSHLPMTCPLHLWVVHNQAKCARDVVPNTTSCPICGHPCCPDCMNHNVEQLSRVTGYMSTVDSWNEAKKQEFKDRQRYNP